MTFISGQVTFPGGLQGAQGVALRVYTRPGGGSAAGAPQGTTMTDENGQYTVSGLAAGGPNDYVVLVEDRLYRGVPYFVDGLAAGGYNTANIQLVGNAPVLVSVSNGNGQGVVGASVLLQGAGGTFRSMSSQGNVYSIRNVVPGAYVVYINGKKASDGEINVDGFMQGSIPVKL